MPDAETYFITWTTYGTWLPGDSRGWRKSWQGTQLPQPLLENWCREQMSEPPVILNKGQRAKVYAVIEDHTRHRRWELLAVNPRTNHVHVVVTADAPPNVVRDQFKANATRVLRAEPDPICQERIWSRGGDCELLNSEGEIEAAVRYVLEAQDRKHLES